jgi:hypothetical protein
LKWKNSGVKDVLKNKARSTGLYGEKDLTVPYSEQDIVWMVAR